MKNLGSFHGWVSATAIVVGSLQDATGAPNGVSAPVLAFIEYSKMVPLAWLVTYANCPEGANAIEVVCEPPANGDPLISVRAPVFPAIEYTETSSVGSPLTT
jgi:hypothetical protein